MYPTSTDAEDAFYRSFEGGDLAAMMAVWAEEGCVCIHPGGERIEGRPALERSWRELFANEARLRFELAARRSTVQGDLAVHSLQERIHVDGHLRGVMIATNVYRRVDGGWQLLVHHAYRRVVS